MMRHALRGSACALLLAFAGCGPLQTPMPPRLDTEAQKDVDASWDKAFAPIGRFDHQGLLDVMVGVQAYQMGVDSLEFRSEKSIAGGKVVMEIHFDRAKPESDRFDVTLLDGTGKLLRSERFSRKEVEETYRELFTNPRVTEEARNPELEARWNRIQEIFPKPKDGVAPPPRPKQ